MWNCGEMYDEPGDFDVGERKAEKGNQEVASLLRLIRRKQ